MSALVILYLLLGLGGLTIPGWFAKHAVTTAPFAAWLSAFELALLLVVIGGFYAVLRRKLPVRLFWELFYFVLAIFGLWYMCFSLLPSAGMAFFVSLFLTGLPMILPRVLVNNIFFVLGSFGAALLITPKLSLAALMILLLGFAAYDFFVTGEHGSFGSLRGMLLARDFFPGFLIPERGGWFGVLSKVPHTISYVTITEMSIFCSLFVRLGVTGMQVGLISLGMMLIFVLFAISFRKAHHPRRLIPWLAMGTVLPLFIFHLFGIV